MHVLKYAQLDFADGVLPKCRTGSLCGDEMDDDLYL